MSLPDFRSYFSVPIPVVVPSTQNKQLDWLQMSVPRTSILPITKARLINKIWDDDSYNILNTRQLQNMRRRQLQHPPPYTSVTKYETTITTSSIHVNHTKDETTRAEQPPEARQDERQKTSQSNTRQDRTQKKRQNRVRQGMARHSTPRQQKTKEDKTTKTRQRKTTKYNSRH
jgi:hypothetical protein